MRKKRNISKKEELKKVIEKSKKIEKKEKEVHEKKPELNLKINFILKVRNKNL